MTSCLQDGNIQRPYRNAPIKDSIMKNRKKLFIQSAFLLCIIIGAIIIVGHQCPAPYKHDTGFVFGTVYNITYQSNTSLKKDIEAELSKVDFSLSPFNAQSVISKINRNEDVVADSMFADVFTMAQKISGETGGAFDITVAPLVNAWGFGFKHDTEPTPQAIDSLRQLIGYEKVTLDNGKVKKADKRIMLDCSAIAKGYACDVVAGYLRSKGIDNFMVEIGGEIVTCGINENRLPWRIGVTKPVDDSLNTKQELQTILNVTNKAMATSGNYRNFYYKNGRKYAHTIDPKTGRPVQHNILSATVLADSCATADAYATAFMVMGLDRARAILDRHQGLMAYFIYSDKNGKNAVWFSPSLKDKLYGTQTVTEKGK